MVVAHPDDETFGCGSVIARAAADGAKVVVCCATRGERGEPAAGSLVDGTDLVKARVEELYEAAAVLGACRVELLDFEDSGWDGARPATSLCGAPFDAVVQAVQRVVGREHPDVVVTLDPMGGDDHRDHVRIAEATTPAFDAVAGEGARLYYWCLVRSLMREWLSFHAGSVYEAAGDEEIGRPDGDITTAVDVADLLPLRLRAIACHRTQTSPYEGLPSALRDAFLSVDHLVRARPRWAGGLVESRLW